MNNSTTNYSDGRAISTPLEWFNQEYSKRFPNDFLSWIEDFTERLECPYPDNHPDPMEMGKRIGSYETQQYVAKKLRYAVNIERLRIENERIKNDN